MHDNSKYFVIDTSAMLNNPNLILELEHVIVPIEVVMELDNLKHQVGDKAYKARLALHALSVADHAKKIVPNNQPISPNNVDSKIIDLCQRIGCKLITDDLAMRIIAEHRGIEAYPSPESETDRYAGIVEAVLDSEEDAEKISSVYTNPRNNAFNLKLNQYLKIDNDLYKWNGSENVKLKYSDIKSEYLGTIKPRNPHQRMAFDLLQDRSTTVKLITGRFGTGKDYLMIAHALNLIEKGKFDRLVWVRNNVEVKDSEPIGFLPSDINSKLLPFAMPLADHVGGVEALVSMLGVSDENGNKQNQTVEIQHLGFIRGRDIKRSIIYCTEAENLTTAHVQLLLGRVGDESEIWFNGDLKQVDREKFETNNGIRSLKRLAGNKLYGQVTLYKTERSDTAALADLLD